MERLKMTAAEVQSGGGDSARVCMEHDNNVAFMPPLFHSVNARYARLLMQTAQSQAVTWLL